MRNMKLLLLLGAVALLVGAMGTSALTAVTVDRSLSVNLKADNDPNAAVKILCIDNTSANGTNYSDLCLYDANGLVQLELHRALNSAGTIGFNRSAAFQIGSSAASARVLGITNNSSNPITVYFNSGNITMYNQTGAALTSALAGSPAGQIVAAGVTHEFYFDIITPASEATSLQGTIEVRAQ